jgi:hypothetical protein
MDKLNTALVSAKLSLRPRSDGPRRGKESCGVFNGNYSSTRWTSVRVAMDLRGVQAHTEGYGISAVSALCRTPVEYTLSHIEQ